MISITELGNDTSSVVSIGSLILLDETLTEDDKRELISVVMGMEELVDEMLVGAAILSEEETDSAEVGNMIVVLREVTGVAIGVMIVADEGAMSEL